GIRLLSGRFTKLCERLRMVLVATHILVYLFPSALTYLALVERRGRRSLVKDSLHCSSLFHHMA
ncbi:hypothetical protein S83_066579, partial [Arachis hypogaea]